MIVRVRWGGRCEAGVGGHHQHCLYPTTPAAPSAGPRAPGSQARLSGAWTSEVGEPRSRPVTFPASSWWCWVHGAQRKHPGGGSGGNCPLPALVLAGPGLGLRGGGGGGAWAAPEALGAGVSAEAPGAPEALAASVHSSAPPWRTGQ